jgi:hypothetical protein
LLPLPLLSAISFQLILNMLMPLAIFIYAIIADDITLMMLMPLLIISFFAITSYIIDMRLLLF